jgi:hypothetical protein
MNGWPSWIHSAMSSGVRSAVSNVARRSWIPALYVSTTASRSSDLAGLKIVPASFGMRASDSCSMTTIQMLPPGDG